MNDLTTTGNPMDDFKLRVLDKLKNDIGSLMPDEALAGLVDEAVRKSFFTKEKVRAPGSSIYRDEWVEKPSWFEQAVMDAIAPLLKERVVAFIDENKQAISDAITAALDRDKLLFLTAGVIGDRVRDGMTMAAMDLMNQLRSQGFIRY